MVLASWLKVNDNLGFMIKGSNLTLTEIEAGRKEYLRTDGYDKNGCHRL